jgi:hypothetical protein
MDIGAVAAPTSGNAWTRRLRLYGKALLLRDSAYQEVLAAPGPRREGLKLLIVLFVTVGLATSLGLTLDLLTLPRVETLEAQVSGFVFNSQAYQALSSGGPTGGQIFNVIYQLFWFVLKIDLGYPSPRDIVFAPLSMLSLGLFRWVTFAVFGEWVARRLGGSARPHAFWAALALAAAPALLRLLDIIPGFYLPGSLMLAWLALTSYQAIRATYPTFSWKRCLAVESWMFALHFICIAMAVVFGVVLGVVLYQALF